MGKNVNNKISGGQAAVTALQVEKTEHVFGLIGSATMEMFDELYDADDINFIGKLVLPFGVLSLDFNGTIDGDSMAGKLTISGLPGGRTLNVDFTGTKEAG